MHNSEGYNIIWKERVASTNTELKALSEVLPGRTVLSAVCQSDGYGQGDHKWHSEPGANLTFSILMKYDAEHVLPASRQQFLTMSTSLAVVDFLKELGIEAGIKKPNDIYIHGEKICGMLIENGICGRNMTWSVIGIGLNVNENTFPGELPNPVSISRLTGRHYDTEKCLGEFLKHFSKRFDAIWTEPDALERDYEDRIIAVQR